MKSEEILRLERTGLVRESSNAVARSGARTSGSDHSKIPSSRPGTDCMLTHTHTHTHTPSKLRTRTVQPRWRRKKEGSAERLQRNIARPRQDVFIEIPSIIPEIVSCLVSQSENWCHDTARVKTGMEILEACTKSARFTLEVFSFCLGEIGQLNLFASPCDQDTTTIASKFLLG